MFVFIWHLLYDYLWPLSSRPSTLYQRSSGAHRSTRTTLHLSTLLQTPQGKTQPGSEDPLSISTCEYDFLTFWSLFTCVRRPAIVVLLMSMVNERQPFVLRCAVLYCFQCFLYKNQKGQGEIVATLLPSTIDGQWYINEINKYFIIFIITYKSFYWMFYFTNLAVNTNTAFNQII